MTYQFLNRDCAFAGNIQCRKRMLECTGIQHKTVKLASKCVPMLNISAICLASARKASKPTLLMASTNHLKPKTNLASTFAVLDRSQKYLKLCQTAQFLSGTKFLPRIAAIVECFNRFPLRSDPFLQLQAAICEREFKETSFPFGNSPKCSTASH